ncbi:MAG: hypothetical protein NTX17_09135 [Candidatus Eisenbacteria bacterium]|nr:hypothetical protein [Candidatus Eisenbacteria bacterium]
MAGLERKLHTRLQNLFYHVAGLGFLFLSKARSTLKGYSSPKPFSISEYRRCAEYDLGVVEKWLSFLKGYTGRNDFFVGKSVLELGPGSDLGVGLYLLAKGVGRYSAIDVNNLVEDVPGGFYEYFFERLKCADIAADLDSLRGQLEMTRKGSSDRLNYVCRDDFDAVSAFGKERIDLIFSQASFEHFDDVESTVRQLSLVARSGAVIVTEIGMMTHSRWIRERDPNNIYRYGQKVYDLFRFRGIPNRVRPFQYREAFERWGWENIVMTPLLTLDGPAFERIRPHLHRDFRDDRNQMNHLSVMLCATKRQAI